MDLAKEVMWYGKNESLPEKTVLRAGALRMDYESGSLRNFRIGDWEILRMIYIALRDDDWQTIVPVIENEVINSNEGGFDVQYKATYQHDDIHFISEVSIQGNSDGQVVFEFKGESRSDFMTNRTGICVLHPIEECAGRNCKVKDPQGEQHVYQFPRLISPHQPMKDISQMSWDIADLGTATIEFDGEIFEMEDQRNWTDDSYKTYCRPLALPFPYELKKGEKVHQRVKLTIDGINLQPAEDIAQYQFTYNKDVTFQLPKIGIARNHSGVALPDQAKELLQLANFDFYTIDVFFDKQWKGELQTGIQEAASLGLVVKLQVQFSENFRSEVEELIDTLKGQEENVDSILILDVKSMVPDTAFVEEIVSLLKPAFLGAKIGSGTIGNFAEINRERPDSGGIDFINYAISPQVHAFDNTTMIENLSGQSATVKTARSFTKGKEIHIGPVGLKPAAIPSADVALEQGASDFDPRQHSLFGGAWVAGSIKRLAEAGASSVSYFQITGGNGILQGDAPLGDGKVFAADSHAVFPIYYMFREVLKNKKGLVLQSVSSHPMEYEGLVLELDGKKTLLLVNFTNEPLKVGIHGFAPNSQVKKLDDKSYPEAVFNSEKYIKAPFCDFKFEGEITMIKMRPYALVIVSE